jgi:hypothetical protein
VTGATTIVYEQSQAIHWEAVLVTAVPAFLAMVGSIVAAVFGHYNGRRVRSIDKAVNGTGDGEPTIRESVEATHHSVEQINTAVNGTGPGEASIQANVQALTDRRDLDPHKR